MKKKKLWKNLRKTDRWPTDQGWGLFPAAGQVATWGIARLFDFHRMSGVPRTPFGESCPLQFPGGRDVLPVETRTASVCHDIDWLDVHDWPALGAIGSVTAQHEIRGKQSMETRYFIMNKKPTPEQLLRQVRSHWAIENSLHWVMPLSALPNLPGPFWV